MSRRRWALALAAAIAACDSAGGEPKRPDILLISIDSLRHDHLGCYGYSRSTSPVIDRLAAEGVRFETAVSTTSWTLPAHAALFTGMYDSAHGLFDNGLSLADGHTTLAETLREHGYQTAGFFGGPYLHPTFGLAQGFDHWQSCMTTIADGSDDESVRVQSRAAMGASHRDVTGPRTLEELGRWLEGADPARPLFAFVHLWDVHYDYIPPPEVAALFVDPAYSGPIDGHGFAEIVGARAPLSKADRDQVIALYDAEIRFTDAIVGRILDRLEQAGRLADTLVVVTADHGEEFFEHGGWGHQGSLFEEQIRIPLVVRWPAVFEPRVIADPVRLIDLMPTLLAIAGVSRQPAGQGRSLVPLLMGGSLEPEPALCELLVDRRGLRALRESRWKYFEAGETGLEGGIDLRDDPGETRMVRGGDAVGAGVQRLRDERDRAVRFREGIVGHGTREIEIPEDLAETLRALGYTKE